MRKITIALALLLSASLASAADKVPAHPHILIETTMGDIKLELEGKLAPITVGHFLKRVDSGFYDGLIFHRVIPGFMAQAGGYTPGLDLKEDDATIPNESGNGLANDEGTIAMARQNPPHTATSQFYINLADNDALNPNPRRWGYTVFGHVVDGMDVVDRIRFVKTDARDVPLDRGGGRGGEIPGEAQALRGRGGGERFAEGG